MKQINERAAEAKQTPLEFICAHVADGGSLLALARQTGNPRSTLASSISRADGGPEAMRASRTEGAASLTERAREERENCGLSREEIAKSRAIAKIYERIASRHDRATYGDTPASFNLNVNLSSAHLQAMRDLNTWRAAKVPSSGDVVEDAEIVDE